MAQQGSPPRRSVRLSASSHRSRSADSGRSDGSGRSGRPGRSERPERPPRDDRSDRQRWQEPDVFDDADDGLPPWAGLNVYPAGPGRREIRPPGPGPDLPAEDEDEGPGGTRPRRSRVAVGRKRRSRQRIYAWAIAAAVVIAAAVSAVWLISSPKDAQPSSFVNTLQRGEFSSVPNACNAVSAAMLAQYLPDPTARKVIQSISTGAQSQCSFTADARPLFRVLEITLQAYQPSALAPGNGSATENAIDSYFQAKDDLSNPPEKSHLPSASVSPLAGVGQAAFSAVQVFRTGKETSDLVTVTARDRNTLITVTLQGLDTKGGAYGPVPVPALQAGALAAARAVLARVSAGPTA